MTQGEGCRERKKHTPLPSVEPDSGLSMGLDPGP